MVALKGEGELFLATSLALSFYCKRHFPTVDAKSVKYSNRNLEVLLMKLTHLVIEI